MMYAIIIGCSGAIAMNLTVCKKQVEKYRQAESAPEFPADPRSTVFSKSTNPLDLVQKIHNSCTFEGEIFYNC